MIVREQALTDSGLLGSYRAAIGLGEGRSPGARNDQSFRLLPISAKKSAPLKPTGS